MSDDPVTVETMAAAQRGWRDIPVRRLLKAPWNYKKGDAERTTKLAASLRRNGLIESLIVSQGHGIPAGRYEVANGNHRLAAFRKAGISRAHCFNLGYVTQEEAMLVAMETNEIRFDPDGQKLSRVLAGIARRQGQRSMLATMPYSREQLAALVDLDGRLWTDVKDDPGGSGRTQPISLTVATLVRLRKAMETFGARGYSATIGQLCRRELARRKR